MQITAVYTGYEFRVHKAHCPDIPLIGEPDVHERLHLTGMSREQVVRRVWADALSTPKRPQEFSTYAKLTKFLPCCGELPEAETPTVAVFHRPAGYEIDGVTIDELVYDGSLLRSAVAHGEQERVRERQFRAWQEVRTFAPDDSPYGEGVAHFEVSLGLHPAVRCRAQRAQVLPRRPRLRGRARGRGRQALEGRHLP